MQQIMTFFFAALTALLLAGQTQAQLINSFGYTFTPADQLHPDQWGDPAELERVWDASIVFIPGQGRGILKTNVKKLSDPDPKVTGTWPTLIFMHGCSGITNDVLEKMDVFAEMGFAVIAPASYARVFYPQSCNTGPGQMVGAIYPDIVLLRMFDAIYAVEQAKSFDWVDAERVVLGGHSEGAAVTALFEVSHPDLRLAGRLIESWTCSAESYLRFQGLNAEDHERVLALVNLADPWLAPGSGFEGSCGAYFAPGSDSLAIFYDQKTPTPHAPLRQTEAQEDAQEFFEAFLQQ